MRKTIFVNVVLLLLVSLIVFAEDDTKEEGLKKAVCGDGVCEVDERYENCPQDCRSDAFSEEEKRFGKEEKKSIFQRIINFFRKLFWKEDKLCKELCEKTTAHADCAGRWEVSGTYPDCLCNFVCEAIEEQLPKGEKQILPESEVKCPDGICDDFEMREGACAQDCKDIEGWGEKTGQPEKVDVKELEEEEEIIDESLYAYTLAEFVQKQQTFSPYTKYEPNFAVDKVRSKIYYVFKAMDDDDIWQVWTAISDLDGNNWQQVQQTTSKENKQRAGILYDPKDDLLHYFYQVGSERGAAERLTRRLITAIKKPDEEKWHDEKVLIDNDGIDDTLNIALDSVRRRIVLAYTKDQQVTTARIDLNDGSFKETVHTANEEMSFIPNMAYDKSTDTVYLVFPRAREPIPRVFDNKDLWLAKMQGDGSNYRETRLTKTDYDNTWPFMTLDLPRRQFYVVYRIFDEPTTYSEEGIADVKEKMGLGRAHLDGSNWESHFSIKGIQIYGIDPGTGVLYGTYGEADKNYFVVYSPENDELKKQLIARGDKLTQGDAAYRTWDSESKMIFGAQQVCHPAGNRAMECQIWTYHGRVLDGEKSILTPQTKAEMAPAQPRKLPEFRITDIVKDGDRIKINTNRKLSMPMEIKVISNGQEVKWEPSQFSQIDQDKGLELRFLTFLASYEATYKICALSDPEKPECQEGVITWG